MSTVHQRVQTGYRVLDCNDANEDDDDAGNTDGSAGVCCVHTEWLQRHGVCAVDVHNLMIWGLVAYAIHIYRQAVLFTRQRRHSDIIVWG